MANVIQAGTATYAGKDAGELIAKALITGDSLSQDVFTIRQNAKGKSVLRTIDIGRDALQGVACDFNATGGDINNKEVTLDTRNVQIEVCKDELNIDFTAFDMGDGVDGGLSAEGAAAFADAILHRVAIAVDEEIWDMITEEAFADAEVVKPVLVAFTVDNVLEQIGLVYAALANTRTFNTAKGVIVVSPQIKALYEQALAANGAMPSFYVGEKGVNYLGVRIVSSIGLSKNASAGIDFDYIIGSNVDNLFYLTDLDNDRNQVSVKDMNEHDLSNNIRFKAHWSQAASYAFGSEFIMGTDRV